MVTKPAELAKALKAYRLDRHMTQEEMANLLGIERSTVSRLESAKSVSAQTLYLIEKKIGKALELVAA